MFYLWYYAQFILLNTWRESLLKVCLSCLKKTTHVSFTSTNWIILPDNYKQERDKMSTFSATFYPVWRNEHWKEIMLDKKGIIELKCFMVWVLIWANLKVIMIKNYYLSNPAATWQVLTGSGAEKEPHNSTKYFSSRIRVRVVWKK